MEQENSNEILFKKIETIAKLKDINGLWKLYNEKISPDSPKKLLKYGAKNVITLKRNLEQNANFDIDIVSTKEKEYFIIKDKEFSNFTIDKNNCLIELTPENINEYLNEYTPDLLKTYLNNLIKENSENENIPLPTLEDYNKFLSITDKNSKFIIDSIPDIKKDFDLIEYNENMSAEEKLESIVQKERKELSKFRDIEKDNLAGDCEDSTRRVIKDCTSKGLEDAIYFSPDRYASGYKKGAGKNNKVEGHNCTIVNIDGQSYLIDCTYRQFFVKENENRHCGKYMLNDENRKDVAERILKNGWIEATPQNIKSYMDGFVMAARGSFDDIEITAEEYLERINNNSDVPIHIITKREIVEASIDRKIAQEKNENIENLFENLSKEKKEIQTL